MRLDELARREGDDITIEWKSFLLRPAPEERSKDQFADYTESWARPAGMEPETSFSYPWAGGAPPESSVNSAVAGKVAAQLATDGGHEFHRRLLRAYFTDNRTISDLDTLADVAEEAGLSRDEFTSTFHDQHAPLLRQVYDEHNLAVNSGITGVPAVVVDERFLVPGAVDADQYERVLEHVRTERAAD